MRDKAFNIANNPKCDGYRRNLSSMIYKLFNKNSSATRAQSETLAMRNKFAAGAIKDIIIFNKELEGELQKPIITKFAKKKVQSAFIDNIWGPDLTDMQLLSKFNKGFLLCVIDIYSKYAWAIPLKDKKDTTITNSFQKNLDELICNPSKTWVGKGTEFYKRSLKSFWQNNGIEVY